MEPGYNMILLIAGILFFLGVLMNKPSRRYGIPGLLLYLAIGFFIGNGGKYDFVFNFPKFAEKYSSLAISIIIFIGGLETKLSKIRPVLAEGLALSTVGVVMTSLAIALFCNLVLGLGFLEGWLLGSVLSSTDAAAVFSIFQSKKLNLKENIAEALELESGTNDPVAYFMTITLTSIFLGDTIDVLSITKLFFIEIAIASIAGFIIGKLTIYVYNKLNLDNKGLYPILLLSVALFLIGLIPLIKGNLLLAMYIAGITIGNGNIKYKQISFQFFDSISWLMEISLFTVLGLQIFPSDLIPQLSNSIIITIFLVFIARPLSVFLIFLFNRKASFKKKLFISWVGLRGATPIVFGLIPFTAQVRYSELIFNSVFIIVIFSVMIQGSTIGWFAEKLKLEESEDIPESNQIVNESIDSSASSEIKTKN